MYHDRDLRNRWAHFAHIFNGSQVLLYLDGNLVANWTRGGISTGNTDTFQFGRWRNDTNAYFQGILDDFRGTIPPCRQDLQILLRMTLLKK